MNIENTHSQMRKGILEFCILSVIRRGEAYPSDIVEEMKRVDLQILEGTLYPLLTRLKNASMLSYRWVESSSGPPRKYFSLTPVGEQFYRELETTWKQLSHAVNILTAGKAGRGAEAEADGDAGTKAVPGTERAPGSDGEDTSAEDTGNRIHT